MKILAWGTGNDFKLIMEHAEWKSGFEITGFLESKKCKNTYEFKGRKIPVYDPHEIKLLEYDYILISNGYFEECWVVLNENSVDSEKIIVPYFNRIFKDKNLIASRCSKCFQNAIEVIEILNKQHHYIENKRILIYGDGVYLWQFLSVSTKKMGVEIIGVVTTTHSIQGYIKIFGRETKIIEQYEMRNLDFDMILILDQNALNLYAELSMTIDRNKLSIPFMTGIEENKYEIVVRLLPYLFDAENIVDTLSTLYSSGRQPQHMTYDILNYSLFNCLEYRKLGFSYPTIGRGVSDDYTRIRTLELLIGEINKKKLEGSIAEVGVFGGEFSKILKYYFKNKDIYLYDTFEGFDERDYAEELKNENFTEEWMQIFKNTSLESVQKLVGKEENIHYRKGWFPESILDEERKRKFCLVSLDVDMYAPTLEGLKFFYPRLEEGGYIMIHEYNAIILKNGIIQDFSGIKRAVKDFEIQYGNIQYVPIADRNGSLIITK